MNQQSYLVQAVPRGGGAARDVSSSTTCLSSSATAVAVPKEIFRKDYLQPANWVKEVSMKFDITPNLTTIASTLTCEKNPLGNPIPHLVLDGDSTSVTLLSISVNGKALTEGVDYEKTADQIIVKSLPEASTFSVETVVTTVPEMNTQLSGLYKSGSMYCTQCEAEGFRRITYFPDRPDNMATFKSVEITADEKEYPALLSNGNLISSTVNGGRKTVVWSDPFPKPSYLFAVVAGNLGSVKSTFVTSEGRKVEIGIFSEKGNENKLDWAMDSIKRAMKWDEDTFNLPYDLDIFNIVAVSDFNMGAMENKGLNVFNSALILADKNTASDDDYGRIEGVLGHEHFHNWTGNRVTLRDWFQLTLKEGLTVFRDQQFSGDMGSPAVTRIENVKGLRGRQFAEDAGPMSHPIRPESYIAMDNFYTSTVYSKGAEVIRMYYTILSPEGFRKGMDLYFARHDGNAVTCDDFRSAMSDANDFDFTQFERWYTQSGTPQVTYDYEYDASSGKFNLSLEQSTPTQPSNDPFHIPIRFGIVDSVAGEVLQSEILQLTEASQQFSFDLPKNLDAPVPSLLRGFSAPVKLVRKGGACETAIYETLAKNDSDGFNRWEAGQKLATKVIFEAMEMDESELEVTYGDDYNVDEDEAKFASLFSAFEQTLTSTTITDESIRAYSLLLPSESSLAEEVPSGVEVDPLKIKKARGYVKRKIADRFSRQLFEKYYALTAECEKEGEKFSVDSTSVGRRKIRNVVLDFLTSARSNEGESKASAELAYDHFEKATCMTDKLAALNALASLHGNVVVDDLREKALNTFYGDANGDDLVINKWFSIQALADLPDIQERVEKLTQHPDFTLTNPNRCRSLVSVFAMNTAGFHAEDGRGYEFLGTKIQELDKLNPQLSSRMAGSLILFKKFGGQRAELMRAQLEKIRAMDGISNDLYEIVDKALK